MNANIIQAGNDTLRQLGTQHDIIVTIIQLMVTVELIFSLGYIHNQLYPPFKSDEEIMTTYQFVVLQSITLIPLFAIILFVNKMIRSLYPFNTYSSVWLECITINIVFIIVAQTQRSFYNRIKMVYKKGFSLMSCLLNMINL